MRSRVVLIERHQGIRSALANVLHKENLEVVQCAGWDEARGVIGKAQAICLGNLSAGELDTIAVLRRIRASSVGARVVLWLPKRTEPLLLEALRAGASDFFRQDESFEDVARAVCCGWAAAAPPASAERSPADLGRLIGGSDAISKLRSNIPRMGASNCTVLITGETGSGKDLAAELIHRNSSRASGPYVCINCAAVPDTLLESELFGYDRGAFTGASSLHRGKLEHANHGTVFLDEIGEMSLYAQSKILRAIESREIQRLGSNTTIPIDIRIIAATNQKLTDMVAAKTFRSDLFFRLNVARLHLPPLRERKQDIPMLLEGYIADFNRRTGYTVAGWTECALERLMMHDWPGNVRELKNLIEAVFINPPNGPMSSADLPDWFKSVGTQLVAARSDRQLLVETLSSTRWNKSKAAEKLKWSRMTVYRKMLKYGIPATPGQNCGDLPTDIICDTIERHT